MLSQEVIHAADVAETLTVFIALVGYIPQWLTLFRSKSSENINLGSWYVWLVSCLCSVFYAGVQYMLNPGTWVLLFSCGLSTFLLIGTIFLIIYYRPERQKAREQALEPEASVALSRNKEAAEYLDYLSKLEIADNNDNPAAMRSESQAALIS